MLKILFSDIIPVMKITALTPKLFGVPVKQTDQHKDRDGEMNRVGVSERGGKGLQVGLLSCRAEGCRGNSPEKYL